MNTALKSEKKKVLLLAEISVVTGPGEKKEAEEKIPALSVLPFDISRWISSRLRPIDSALHE